MQNWVEDMFKPTTGNESLHQDSDDNSVRIVNFCHNKTFRHRNSDKCTWTSDGKTHNKIYHMLIDTKWHSTKIDVR
jgi:hypothetical protein